MRVLANKLNLANLAILSIKERGSTIQNAIIKYIQLPAPD